MKPKAVTMFNIMEANIPGRLKELWKSLPGFMRFSENIFPQHLQSNLHLSQTICIQFRSVSKRHRWSSLAIYPWNSLPHKHS